MNSVINSTLDVVDYIVNESLEKLADVVAPLSEAAKKAYVPTVEESQGMDENQFGVVLWHPTIGKFNKFAMNEPAVTEINLALLANNADNLPEEVVKIAGANLTCAAKGFGLEVPEVLQKYASDIFIENLLDVREIDSVKFASKTKKASKRFATSDGEYPINTKLEVEKAAEYFDTYHNSFSPNTKLEYAINVTKAAKELDVDLSDTGVNKYASLDTTNFRDDFKYHIESRLSFLKDAQNEEKELYNELLIKSAEIGPNKTAAALYVVDKQTGLASNYGQGLADPLMAVMDIKKEAGMVIDEKMVTHDQLTKLSNEDLTPIVGNNVIAELKGDEGLEVLASLPKPVRQEVLDLIK